MKAIQALSYRRVYPPISTSPTFLSDRGRTVVRTTNKKQKISRSGLTLLTQEASIFKSRKRMSRHQTRWVSTLKWLNWLEVSACICALRVEFWRADSFAQCQEKKHCLYWVFQTLHLWPKYNMIWELFVNIFAVVSRFNLLNNSLGKYILTVVQLWTHVLSEYYHKMKITLTVIRV